MTEPIRVLTRNIDEPDSASIDTYLRTGGYKALEKALSMKPAELIDMVKASELRGRGGAGFPTGMKWGFVPQDSGKPVYLLCNADEAEPGTFKDRLIIEKDPHLMIEGMIISAYAIGSGPMSYIYIRGEFAYGAKVLEKALAEAREKGFLGKNILGSGFDHDVTVHRGAGAYICGEETGLIESLEGKRGEPRVKPPFPAVVGVFGAPTVVNNVETIACVTLIVEKGPDWFRSIGVEKNTGPKLYCVSGHVKKPGVYEFPMTVNLKELIVDHCGGTASGLPIKAVIPGGGSAPILKPDEIDIPLTFDAVQKAGSMLGSAAIMVMDESACIVECVWRLVKFFAHESCGQCTPCREGCNWMESVLHRLETGQGRQEDADLLLDMSDNIGGKSLCALGDAAIGPVISGVQKFRDEFLYHVEHKSCLPNTRKYSKPQYAHVH